MGKFLESEKPKQAKFKADAPYFSDLARVDGVYKGKSRSFCLPVEFAEQNLLPEIRATSISHFARHKIKWHDGQTHKPSNHLKWTATHHAIDEKRLSAWQGQWEILGIFENIQRKGS